MALHFKNGDNLLIVFFPKWPVDFSQGTKTANFVRFDANEKNSS